MGLHSKQLTPTPNKNAAHVAELAAVLLGPLHSLVATWLVGRTPDAACNITGLPVRSVLSAARGLVDCKLINYEWKATQESTAAGAFEVLQRVGSTLHCKPGEMERKQSAHQVLKARKRRAAQQLRRRGKAVPPIKVARVPGPGAYAAAAGV